MKAPVVYLLASKPRGTLYTGVTSNLVRRVWQHREGLAVGFTKRYGAKTLVWYEQHPSMLSAIAREKAIKKWLRQWKLDLIEQANAGWRDLWPDIAGLAPAPGIPANTVTARSSVISASEPSFSRANRHSRESGIPRVHHVMDSRVRGNDDPDVEVAELADHGFPRSRE